MGALTDIISEDEWLRRGTDAAIAKAREMVQPDIINPRAMVGSLSDQEWSWIVASVIFGWVNVRSQQAIHEGKCADIVITNLGSRIEPWDVGAVKSILPALGDIEGLDWEKPIGEWSEDGIIRFLWGAFKLIDAALAARDEGAMDLRPKEPRRIAREMSAANGGPLMDPDELLGMVMP